MKGANQKILTLENLKKIITNDSGSVLDFYCNVTHKNTREKLLKIHEEACTNSANIFFVTDYQIKRCQKSAVLKNQDFRFKKVSFKFGKRRYQQDGFSLPYGFKI